MTRILYDFLQHGQLGRIDVGMSVDETLAYLGAPDEFDSVEAFYAQLLQMRTIAIETHPARVFQMRYGTLDMLIQVDTNQIELFKVHFRNGWARSLPQILDDGWLLLVDGITRARCADLLRSYRIKSWQIDQGQWATYVCELWLPSSGLTLSFNLEDGDDSLLVLSKSEEANPCFSRLCTEFT